MKKYLFQIYKYIVIDVRNHGITFILVNFIKNGAIHMLGWSGLVNKSHLLSLYGLSRSAMESTQIPRRIRGISFDERSKFVKPTKFNERSSSDELAKLDKRTWPDPHGRGCSKPDPHARRSSHKQTKHTVWNHLT